MRAAVRLDDDDALVGERLQGGADDGAARAEKRADLVFGKPRAGRQAMVENRRQQRGVDARRARPTERGSARPFLRPDREFAHRH